MGWYPILISWCTKDPLSRLANVLGKPLYVDQVTSNQDRITYARVLINTDITISYKNKVIVEDEDGKILTLKVEYKWKPLVCSKCNSLLLTHS